MTPTDRRFILSFDQGTTNSRAIVFDHTGTVVSLAQQEFPQLYSAPGLAEHDPEAIWSSQLAVARAAISKTGISAAVPGTLLLWSHWPREPLVRAYLRRTWLPGADPEYTWHLWLWRSL
jgi:glycerol kinase